MEPRLTHINENEALQYMGYRGEDLPASVLEDLSRCKNTILQKARPRITYRIFTIDEDGYFGEHEFYPQGNAIRELLLNCKSAVVFGATLGLEIERLLKQMQVRNMADAVMMDACASAAIENVCDHLMEDLEQELSCYLTDRFSPGYGDLPFAQQGEVAALLDLPRQIGVTLSPTGLMIPQKSVTAITGIADTPQKKRFRGCAYCNNFKNCQYRKEKRYCGRE